MNHTGTQTIMTPRLILRRFVPSDASVMYRNWASDPEVTRYLTWSVHQSPEDTKKLLELWAREYEKQDTYHWCIELKSAGEAVGDISLVSLKEHNRCGEIGYCLSRRHWGQGIMTEAFRAVLDYLFDTVGFHRIQAKHILENTGSGRVMRKCGLIPEGRQRESFLLLSDGQFHDLICYAVLAADSRPGR